MAVKIRLQRHGSKKKPFYRIAVVDERTKRDGRFIEILGNYDPNKNPPAINIKLDKVQEWINKGAQTSDTVKSLIKKAKQVPVQ